MAVVSQEQALPARKEKLTDYEMVHIRLSKADEFINRGEYESARKELQEVLKIDFENREALDLLMRVDNILNILK